MNTCRDEILDVGRFFLQREDGTMTSAEMVAEMRSRGVNHAENTIRTPVISLKCKDALVDHPTSFDDLDRVDFGQYQLSGALRHTSFASGEPSAVVEQALESRPAESSKVQREAESVGLQVFFT